MNREYYHTLRVGSQKFFVLRNDLAASVGALREKSKALMIYSEKYGWVFMDLKVEMTAIENAAIVRYYSYIYKEHIGVVERIRPTPYMVHKMAGFSLSPSNKELFVLHCEHNIFHSIHRCFSKIQFFIHDGEIRYKLIAHLYKEAHNHSKQDGSDYDSKSEEEEEEASTNKKVSVRSKPVTDEEFKNSGIPLDSRHRPGRKGKSVALILFEAPDHYYKKADTYENGQTRHVCSHGIQSSTPCKRKAVEKNGLVVFRGAHNH